jgi:hypothetical protein
LRDDTAINDARSYLACSDPSPSAEVCGSKTKISMTTVRARPDDAGEGVDRALQDLLDGVNEALRGRD